MDEALTLYRQGAVHEAERRYREVLQRQPDHAEAHYYFAAIACHQGRHIEAIEGAKRALSLGADPARAHCLIGAAFSRLGRHAEALEAYENAIACNPGYARAYGERGDLLTLLERHEEAIASYDQALAIEPNSAEDWNRRAAALVRLARFEEAASSFGRVTALRPRDADAHNNRAQALMRLGRDAEALTCLDQALEIDPEHPPALATRAHLFNALGRHAEALADAEKLLGRIPDHRSGLMAYSDALAGLDRTEDAIAGLDRVLASRPDDSFAKYCKSLLMLNLGRLQDAWPLYEERWNIGFGHHRRNYPQPRFAGGYCPGIVLAWGEHGLGDQIIYASMIEDLTQRAKGVVIEVEPRLVPLMARSFAGTTVVGRGFGADPPLYPGRVDAQAAMGSLGAIFRPSLADFPQRHHGYLRADAWRTQHFRAQLAAGGLMVVGVSWRSVNPQTGSSKSAALKDFAPLLHLPGCRFVDLQYGDTAAERAECEANLGIRVERLPLDHTNDIDGLAALISACDVVVSVSNTTAHLAGALGVPTWVMVPSGYARIWYWFKNQTQSPWYPRVRVFRKAFGQPWTELINTLAADVEKHRDQFTAR